MTDFNLFQSHLLSQNCNTVEYTALNYNGHTKIPSQFSQPLHQYKTEDAHICHTAPTSQLLGKHIISHCFRLDFPHTTFILLFNLKTICIV